MNVAFGIKAHSGWAALVVLGAGHGALQIVNRARMELVEQADASWAKQPYHAAEALNPNDARDLVARGREAARRLAIREMQAAIVRTREAGHDPVVCAVLTGKPMPDWTVEEILGVHFRMHKAEGVLFRDALARAAESCLLKLRAIPEKQLAQQAGRLDGLRKTVAALGRSAGPPWGKDQKDAALAALIALGTTG